MLFAQHREIRSRVWELESKVDLVNENLIHVETTLVQKIDQSFTELLNKLKPLQSDAEKAEILLKADEKRHQQIRSNITFACLVILPSLVTAIGIVNYIGLWWLKTQVHVPVPTVEVQPPTDLDHLHPLGN